MSLVEDLATRRAQQQVTLAFGVMLLARQLWGRLDQRALDTSWAGLVGELLAALVGAQTAAASGAPGYVAQVIRALGGRPAPAGRLLPGGFSGRAADGRALETLLLLPLIEVKTRIAAGQPLSVALEAGLGRLLRYVASETTDAGRTATGAVLTADRAVVGYQRQVRLPACSRCIILAGRVYSWSQGFQRHPRCDCVHVPVTRAEQAGAQRRAQDEAERIFKGLSRGEQDRVFGRADAQAVRDGANLGQVVNARRGMSTTVLGGRQVRTTSEGTTVRGSFGRQAQRAGATTTRQPGERVSRVRALRLTPEEIYQVAQDRDDAIRLLKVNGYLV